jgi:hypothetical protein
MSFENVTGGGAAASVERAVFATVAQAVIANAMAHDLIGKALIIKTSQKGKLGTC